MCVLGSALGGYSNLAGKVVSGKSLEQVSGERRWERKRAVKGGLLRAGRRVGRGLWEEEEGARGRASWTAC